MREGPMFEAMIMNREINNPMYRSVQLDICNVLPVTVVGLSFCKVMMRMLMFTFFFFQVSI